GATSGGLPRAREWSRSRCRHRARRRGAGAGMRFRDLIFGALAVALLVGYIVVGQRVSPLLLLGTAVTATPPRPTGQVSAPTVNGTIAFILRGDVFVLVSGKYASRTEEGRSEAPA